METVKRRPFEGVKNIVRFNWHFYIIGAFIVIGLIVCRPYIPASIYPLIAIISALAFIGILSSLAASFYIYDLSNLYSLDWLDSLNLWPGAILVNINAGFDETSYLLASKYPGSSLAVFDFYNSAKHTEISIERARKIHSVYPGTRSITTSQVPLENQSIDFIFLIMAAHEIRDRQERIAFLKELKNKLKPGGKIIIVEHLRNLPNFIAYNVGFFHFFSEKEWKNNFNSARLQVETEIKITPFVSAFFLQ